ncbi:MAG: hypothetical protein ACREPJ_16990, partial [Rhodanobacteraceae bacterium]
MSLFTANAMGFTINYQRRLESEFPQHGAPETNRVTNQITITRRTAIAAVDPAAPTLTRMAL